MFGFFTRDTAAQRKIERLEGLVEVLADEKADALELVNKLMKARDMWKGVARQVTLQRDNLRQEVAEQTRNATKLGQKLTETKKALEVECDRANAAQSRLYSFTAPRRRDPRGRFLPLRDMGTAA